MNVLSLFDGMSCGQIALERAGIKVDNYFASEIDKHTIKVTIANYPNTVQLGDVTKVCAEDLPQIDLLCGGSPCQGFSFAGKQLNFDDPRSKLFFEYIRLLAEIRVKNPDVKFLLENVKMKKEYQNVISEALGVEPVLINSALVSAQNRNRLYWTNIEGVGQPADKGIVIADIVETYDGFIFDDRIVAIAKHNSKVGMKCIGGIFGTNKWLDDGKNLQMNFSQGKRIYGIDGKSPTLSSSGGGEVEQGSALIAAYPAAIRGRYLENGVRQDSKMVTKGLTSQYCERGMSNKSNCLTTVAKDNVLIVEPITERILAKDIRYRNLTRLECERLQTLPEGYTNSVSENQAKRAIGNGWTVDVIVHIFKGLLK